MMRRLTFVVCLLVVAAACTVEPDPTVPSPPTTMTTKAPASGTTAPTDVPATTATSVPPPEFDAAVLVTNSLGVFQIDTGGNVIQLVHGPVSYAVDDTQGGLLFQVDRGRDWGAFWHEPDPDHDTEVWWIPRGAAAAQELLVPTPGMGHSLTLHDAYPTADSFVVVYQRHEGTEPPFGGDMQDTLRTFDVASTTVSQLFDVRGWEWNLSSVSAGGGLVVATENQILGSGCRLFGDTGQLTSRPGVPTATQSCFDESTACPTGCELSTDGSQVAYVANPSLAFEEGELAIVVQLVATGRERSRVLLPLSHGSYHSFSLTESSLLINRGEGEPHEAWLVDIDEPEEIPQSLPVAGLASFAHTQVDIDAPVPSPGLVAGGLSYYRYGVEGLFQVVDGVETRLVEEAVMGAWDDHMGGVLFATGDEVHWLRAGDTVSTTVDHRPLFTGVLTGRPTLFYAGFKPAGRCREYTAELVGHDLITGEETATVCVDIEDTDMWPSSVGGDLFVGAQWVASGASWSGSVLNFWDTAGDALDVAVNPVAESCLPCELSARVSPDGQLLAYRHRADAPWPLSVPGGDHIGAWWETSRDITGEVAVVDLESGDVVWMREVPAWVGLADFEGRYLVTTTSRTDDFDPSPVELAGADIIQSTIHDTWDRREPVTLPGGVTLIREPLAVSSLRLRSDGLGIVSFGDPVDSVMETLTGLLGPPTSDELLTGPWPGETGCPAATGYGCVDYLRFVEWETDCNDMVEPSCWAGLRLVFTDGSPTGDVTLPAVTGWFYSGGLGLSTPVGVTVGTTVSELQGMAEQASLSDEPDHCEGSWMAAVDEIGLFLSGDPADPANVVTALFAGRALSSC